MPDTRAGGGPDEPIFVYTTFPDAEAARAVARVLVEERRVACANILPGMESVYRWEGRIETGSEAVMILKSVAGAAEALAARIAALHPYDVPAIVVLPISGGHPAYLAWIAAETGPPAR